MTALPQSPSPGRAARASGLASLLLIALTAVWGSTFFLIKDLLVEVPATDFLAVRFGIAAIVMVAVFWKALRRLTRREVAVAAGLGGLYGIAQILQTIGLAHTDASVSGFITGLYVVLTPILGGLLLRDRIAPVVWVAVALSLAGLAVLSLRGSLALGPGELLTLACAAVYALHIIGLGRYSTITNANGMSAVQMVVIAAIALVASLSDGRVQTPTSGGGWASLIYMAIVAGVLALWAQTWAQARMSATRAAIVMTLEPVFAAGFAVLFGGESATWRMLLGGGLVVAAMFVVELGPRPKGAPPAEALHHEV